MSIIKSSFLIVYILRKFYNVNKCNDTYMNFNIKAKINIALLHLYFNLHFDKEFSVIKIQICILRIPQ